MNCDPATVNPGTPRPPRGCECRHDCFVVGLWGQFDAQVRQFFDDNPELIGNRATHKEFCRHGIDVDYICLDPGLPRKTGHPNATWYQQHCTINAELMKERINASAFDMGDYSNN